MGGSRGAAGLLLLLSAGCRGSLPPLRGHIEVGRDPFVVFVGGSSRAGGDLFAVPASGGSAVQITFTAVGEMRPALSPDGGALAFLRGGSLSDSTPTAAWVMNLLSGSEREVELPAEAGAPVRIGWMDDGSALAIATGSGLYRAPAPPASGPARPVAAAGRAVAESALAVLLGDPVFARVVRCDDPAALCVQADSGTPAVLARDADAAARWGADSVALLVGEALVVRPVGAGRARVVEWTGLPARPRDPTVFAGATPARR